VAVSTTEAEYMASASVIETATVGCSLLFQLIAPPFKINTNPVVDLLVSESPA